MGDLRTPVTIGKTELTTPTLGVGAMTWNRKDVQGAHRAFQASLDAGVTLIDTAEMYGRGQSERLVGYFLQRSEREALVATKFAPLPTRLRPSSLSKALAGSLRRLRMESVDLYQVHWPFSFLKIEPLMEAMADEIEAGRIKAVGVSNYNADQMRRAFEALERWDIPLASNQVNYSLLHRDPEQNGVLNACRELNVALIAYTPLASGALSGKYGPGSSVDGIRRMRRQFRKIGELQPLIEELASIGNEHEKTPAQVALNWLARQEGVIPIPGAKDSDQATSNAGALDFELTQGEAERLDLLSAEWAE